MGGYSKYTTVASAFPKDKPSDFTSSKRYTQGNTFGNFIDA
jgi:hypothetical protein